MDAEKTTNSFVILLKSLLLVFLLTTLGCEMPKENPPNVLLIMIDDLNDCIETLKGHPQSLTPNMRKLAQSGVAFLNCSERVRVFFRTGLLNQGAWKKF